MKSIFAKLRNVSLIWYNIMAFVFGACAGIVSKTMFAGQKEIFDCIVSSIAPFGSVLVAMLKAVVIPIIFFSLIDGASSLPLKKFGKLGSKVIAFYMLTSLLATLFGVVIASVLAPSVSNPEGTASSLLAQVGLVKTSFAEGGNMFVKMLLGVFANPFQALAESRFLSIIVFAIIFGLAARAMIESSKESDCGNISKMLNVFDGINKTIFKMVGWMMFYFPVGIFSLTFVNFSVYGIELFGSYAEIAMCVIIGIILMILVVYPAIIYFTCRENPYKILIKLREPIITAFATRSSAATLPVSLATAEQKLKVRPEISGFALSLGATINMDGVCLHLPVFVILAASIFGIDITTSQMFLVVISVVFASIGTGGIPGGSIFLLFLVLDVLHLTPSQASMIVALALGINPLLDMFETACNVAGDNVGNYVVAKTSSMLQDDVDV